MQRRACQVFRSPWRLAAGQNDGSGWPMLNAQLPDKDVAEEATFAKQHSTSSACLFPITTFAGLQQLRHMAAKPDPVEYLKSLKELKFGIPNSPFSTKRGPEVKKQVLYKGKWMPYFRIIVRAKALQMLAFLTVIILIGSLMMQTNPDPFQIVAVAGVTLGIIGSSYCIWYYSSRYIGELSLILPERRVARISVMDFWGAREDNDVAVERIEPPFRHRTVGQVKAMCRRVLMPIKVKDDREYYISVPYGTLSEKAILQDVLYGRHLLRMDEIAAAEARAAKELEMEEGEYDEDEEQVTDAVSATPTSDLSETSGSSSSSSKTVNVQGVSTPPFKVMRTIDSHSKPSLSGTQCGSGNSVSPSSAASQVHVEEGSRGLSSVMHGTSTSATLSSGPPLPPHPANEKVGAVQMQIQGATQQGQGHQQR